MHRVGLIAVAIVVALAPLNVEARPRGGSRGVAAGAPSAPVVVAPAPVRSGADTARGRSAVIVSSGSPAASTRIGTDIPTGTLGTAATPAISPQPVRAQPTQPRDPCASNKLFGQGAGFCSVN